MKLSAFLNRFTMGEVSPFLSARTDLQKYPAGARRMENFIPLLQGPVVRRGGTRFIAQAGNGGNPVLLISFSFSETTSYILELGHNYLRCFYEGRPVLLDDQIYQIETPWTQGDLFLASGLPGLRQVQSGDIMWIVCAGRPPQKLERHGHTDWRIVPVPNWGERPNPTSLALFRERLCFAAGQTIWMSQSGAFDNFDLTVAAENVPEEKTLEEETPEDNEEEGAAEDEEETPAEAPVAADDPIEINVYSEQIDRIEWLCPGKGLLCGTTGGEFIIEETTKADPLGPENVKVSTETPIGSCAIQAMRVGQAVLFVQRSGRKLREFIFDLVDDGFSAGDLTVAAEHITAGGITALAWQSEPLEIVWAPRRDGVLVGLSYSREQEMGAWHRHCLGGRGAVSHLAVVPARHGGRDVLWLSVRRVIAGQTVYYIETLEPGHELGAAQEDCFFVDSGLTFQGNQLTEITGLNHLEGCEVDVLGDGGVQPRRTVTAGRIDLEYPANVIQVGLPYDSVFETVNLEFGLQDGTAQGRRKRIVNLTMRLIESGGGAVGSVDGGPVQKLEQRRGSDKMNEPPRLFSGDLKVAWPGGYDTDGRLTILQTFPLPFIVAGLIPDAILEDKN